MMSKKKMSEYMRLYNALDRVWDELERYPFDPELRKKRDELTEKLKAAGKKVTS